jgi:putative ABC transport system permease protein
VLALGAGIVVAAVSFTLLTSAASTSELFIKATVAKNFRPAYDVLVRPPGSFTPLERKQALVRENYLSGIFGGITMRQYRKIKQIPGVQVAAPIANVGYLLPFHHLPIGISQFVNSDEFQLYRLHLRWLANGGLSSYPGPEGYVYYTRRDPLVKRPNGDVVERLPSGRLADVCRGFIEAQTKRGLSSDPFDVRQLRGLRCYSRRSPRLSAPFSDFRPAPGFVGGAADVFFPILVAAIDPVEEQRLVGLKGAVVRGRFLRRSDGVHTVKHPFNGGIVPVLASTRSYLDESLRVDIQRLTVPSGTDIPSRLSRSDNTDRWLFRRTGHTVGHLQFDAATFYRRLVRDYSRNPRQLHSNPVSYDGYWAGSPTRYSVLSADRLAPVPVHNPISVFTSTYYGGGWAPQENRDVNFRRLTKHESNPNKSLALHVVGRFDPTKLPGFSQLSHVPLETYYPPKLEPGDAAARKALGGKPLLPTQNLADYVAQPPLMLTTLKGLRGLTNPNFFDLGGVRPRAPISVIRVRVAGVTGPDPLSRARIKGVATAIHNETGLAVDITAGSSPHPVTIDLPQGKFGRPPLTLTEGWVQKGVAVRFLQAIDRKSAALFGLVLAICAIFLANASLASVKARRFEIGTLMCLGWRKAQIFRAILSELALVGMAAGAVGEVIALVLVRALNLHLSLMRTLLVLPLAVVLTVIAGVLPAWRAARGKPLDALRPPVAGGEKVRANSGLRAMATSNLRRLPARTLLGSVGLLLGVGAFTLLLALNGAFRGALVGNLMGHYLSIQVRGADFLSVVLVIALGGLSVADVLYMNFNERAGELVTLATLGWRRRQLRVLLGLEGFGLGLLGSLGGLILGVASSSLIRGIALASIARAAAIAGAVGVVVALLASLAPLALVGRLSAPQTLAEEW